MGDEHLRSDHYVDVDGSGASASMLAHRTHRHLIETCPECRKEWESLGGLQAVCLENLRAFTAPAAPPAPADDELPADPATIERYAAHLDELRYHRRRAQEQMSVLRRLPARKRPSRVRRAHRQFRSRLLAELVIEEGRRALGSSPAEARGWFELVPLVLDWTRGNDGPVWAAGLFARAEAHRANATRVLGDRDDADRAFIELRRAMALRPVGDPGVVAEVASLEARLRIDQDRRGHAAELLDRAALAYRYAGDVEGLARSRLAQADLLRGGEGAGEVLGLLDEAARSLARGSEPSDLHLVLQVAAARTDALCDLGRFDEARKLLAAHLDDFEASDAPRSAAIFRFLAGRAALGLEDHTEAEDSFRSARDAFLSIGHATEAVIAWLYLAETLLAAGRIDELRRLAGDHGSLFRRHELPEAARKALQLLVQAIGAEQLSAASLERLRSQIPTSVTSPPTGEA
jgi:tetratricopeptide (TPR) repeat protein